MYIGRFYILLVLGGIVFSSISFCLDPFGDLLFGIGEFNISSVTIFTFSFSILILWFMFNYVDVLPRILCSISLPVLGMCFYETCWHIGCWYAFRGFFHKTIFWVLYTTAIFMGIVVLHVKYKILNFSMARLVVILIFLLYFRVNWQQTMDTGFFPALLDFDKGLGPDPHTPFVFFNATIGRTVWLLLASSSRKKEELFTNWNDNEGDEDEKQY